MKNKFVQSLIIIFLLIIVFLNSIILYLLIDKKYSFEENVNNETLSNNIIHEYDSINKSNINDFISDIDIDKIVEFGTYYDLGDNEEIIKKPIKWQVLNIRNNQALLITKDIIETLPYNTFWQPTDWGKCSLRKWLNYDFYDIAFNDMEKSLLITKTIINNGNQEYNLNKEFETKDTVFLLSIDEAKRYFDKFTDMKCIGTEYALNEGLWVSDMSESTKGFSVWWLRNPGKNYSHAAIVNAGGPVGPGGDGVATRGNGIRPCIWINLKYEK